MHCSSHSLHHYSSKIISRKNALVVVVVVASLHPDWSPLTTARNRIRFRSSSLTTLTRISHLHYPTSFCTDTPTPNLFSMILPATTWEIQVSGRCAVWKQRLWFWREQRTTPSSEAAVFHINAEANKQPNLSVINYKAWSVIKAILYSNNPVGPRSATRQKYLFGICPLRRHQIKVKSKATRDMVAVVRLWDFSILLHASNLGWPMNIMPFIGFSPWR